MNRYPSSESAVVEQGQVSTGQFVPPPALTAGMAAARRVNVAAHLRGGRRPVHAADLDVYAAIVGRAPTVEERERALELPRIEPYALAPVEHSGLARHWSPAVLCAHLRSVCVCYTGRALRVSRPHISNFVRRISGEAVRAFEATQAKLRHARADAE